MRKKYRGYLKDNVSGHEVYWIGVGRFLFEYYPPNVQKFTQGNPFIFWILGNRGYMFGAYSKWGTVPCT